MKYLLLILSLGFILPVFADVMVGKVDYQKVSLNINEGIDMRETLKNEFDTKQKALEKDEGAMRAAQEDYQKKRDVLSADKRTAEETKLQDMIMKFQQKTMDYQKEIQDLEQKLRDPIMEKLKSIITDVAKKENVDIAVEVGPNSGFLYAKKEKDMTEAVIKLYNEKHPVKKKK